MSQPSTLGPIGQLLLGSGQNPVDYLPWYIYEVRDPMGGRAGRWATENLQDQWTFKVDFGRVWFYIHDAKDAMFFKLTWG